VAGIGTRLEDTRTMSDSSTSSAGVLGETDVDIGAWELAGRPASAIGLGAAAAFGLLPLRRPDCAVALASQRKVSSTNDTANTNSHQAPRTEEFTTLSPASLLFLTANLLAKRPILLGPTPPGIDDGHVSYESGGDLVLPTAAAVRR